MWNLHLNPDSNCHSMPHTDLLISSGLPCCNLSRACRVHNIQLHRWQNVSPYWMQTNKASRCLCDANLQQLQPFLTLYSHNACVIHPQKSSSVQPPNHCGTLHWRMRTSKSLPRKTVATQHVLVAPCAPDKHHSASNPSSVYRSLSRSCAMLACIPNHAATCPCAVPAYNVPSARHVVRATLLIGDPMPP